MSEATIACPCGSLHPEGFFCEKGEAIKTRGHHHEHSHEHGHDHHDHGHAHEHHHEHEHCCGHDHAHEHHHEHGHDHAHHHEHAHAHSHEHGRCCGHDHAHEAASCACDAALANGDASAAARRLVYRIEAMDCPVEEALIRGKLGAMPGIVRLDFDLVARLLTVHHDLPETETKNIEALLNGIGMVPELVAAAENAPPPMAAVPWAKLAVAGALALCAELAELFGFGPWIALPFALAAIALSGLATYRKGWQAVRSGNLNMNALMSAAVTGAVCIGQFPEAAMVMVLFNLSEAIEVLSLARARNAIKRLMAVAPERAAVLGPDGEWTDIDVHEVAMGARVRVRPGEKVALDGVVVAGHSTVNQAPITGESMPVEKHEGDAVFAGTINESGSFEFTVTALASDSTLSRIIRAVEEAQSARAPMQRFVDVFARWYTPAVFLVALLTALLPPLFWGADWAGAVYMGLVVLVIGCPCALVISTPVSIVSGLAAATRHGILIKGGLFLERGRKLGRLALDKTGTITSGRPAQTDFQCLDGDCARSYAIAAALAARSDHPVSRAIAEAAARSAEDMGIGPAAVEDFTALPGEGISGVIAGKTWHLGNHRLVEDLHKCSLELEARIEPLEAQGKTVVVLVGEAGPAALFAVADTVKPGSREALAELRELGVHTVMLTGDNERAAAAIAREVGVDEFRAEMLPQDKLQLVEELEAAEAARGGDGMVGMVGDGINDAPALAKAQIGFAMAGRGTDAAIETADVALMDDDLRKIPRFIRLSRGTCAILMQNIALALGIKALFFALTFAGLATMWMAVFADVGASLIVTANGLRAMRL